MGRGTAELFAERGASVVVDVSDADDVQHFVEETVRTYGSIDVLHNVAVNLGGEGTLSGGGRRVHPR
jgi:3-oxoacyl-[acyl-carrier protein] reductase